jgi:hypothetical protein
MKEPSLDRFIVYYKGFRPDTMQSAIVGGMFFTRKYLVKGDLRVYPNETDSIWTGGYTGIPQGRGWIFRAAGGRIDGYTGKPRRGRLTYIVKDGRLERMRYNALKGMVSDNPSSMRILQNRRLALSGGAAMMVLGLGVVWSAFGASGNDVPSGRLTFGAIIAASGLVPMMVTNRYALRAVEAYNGRR